MLDDNEACETCGRSFVSRFGRPTGAECPSCQADFSLLASAGKLAEDGWTLVVVKIGSLDK